MEIQDLTQAVDTADTDSKQTIPGDLDHSNLRRTLVAGAYIPLSQVSGSVLGIIFTTVLLFQCGVADVFKINIRIQCLALCGQIVEMQLIDRADRIQIGLFGAATLLSLSIAIGSVAKSSSPPKAHSGTMTALCVVVRFVNAVTCTSV